MCKYIEDIIIALGKIPACYVIESNDKNRLAERMFAYEFYHQYRMIMENNPQYKEGYYLCGEQSKLYSKICNDTEKERICPDIVLSGEVEEIDDEKQYWVAEIKMAGNSDWEADIPKLVKYAKSQLKFQYLFYIYVCKNEDSKCKIIRLLEQRKFSKEELEITFFICTPNNETTYIDVTQYNKELQ